MTGAGQGRLGAMDREPTFGLPTRATSKARSRASIDDEPLLDRRRFGTRWRAATWLIVLWTAMIAIIAFAAFTEPANGPTFALDLLVLAAIWGVGMIPLCALWVAAWLRRRRRGLAD